MNHNSDETMPAPGVDRAVDRRRFLRKAGVGAAVTGAAISAPIVIDSFTSPAWASGTVLFHSETYNSTVSSVSVTAGRKVAYDISGAGGGGGASTANKAPIIHQGGAGGAGTRLTGTIPSQVGTYTLWIAIGQKGNRGVLSPDAAEQAKGLSSYAGAASDTRGGGKGAGVLSSGTKPGRGGGGGGVTAISNSSDLPTGTIQVVAPGGGGGGGRGTHWDRELQPNGGSLSTGTFTGVLNGVDGTTGTDRDGYNGPGAKGTGGTSSVGTGGISGGTTSSNEYG